MSGTSVGRLGQTLGGRYQLLAVVGSGASAEVYHARDTRLDRSVAIKQLRSGYTDDPRFLKLFRSEATLAAQLTHPNIMTVFDWSDDADGLDGGPYLVTQLLPGGTLRSVLNQAGTYDEDGNIVRPGTLSIAQVAFIGLQASQGLAFAHEQGLVHRDVKPANLLFGRDGRVHIGDFGIARAVAEAAWTEPEGVLIGTARYAAPEQATDAQIDGVADIYSLTLCLVEALTGDIPLIRENALGTMVQRQSTDVPVDDEWGPLADVLAWGGQAESEDRASSAEFLDAMLSACRELPDPEPLVLLDLTENPIVEHDTSAYAETGAGVGGQPAPNVRFDTGGALVITDDDASDLHLPPRGLSQEEGGGSAAAGQEARSANEAFWGDDYTADTGKPARPPRRRGLRWLKRVVLLLLGLALAGGAVVAGVVLAESRQEIVTIDVRFPTFEVADYATMTAAQVEQEVTPLGWQVRATQRHQDGTEIGDLLTQRPAAGTTLEPGSEQLIELEYSLGPEMRVVPQLVGGSYDDGAASLASLSLTVGDVSEQHDEQVAAGVVLEAMVDGEAVEPGVELVTGSVVDLVVSSGPAPRKIPDVASMTQDQATKAISDAGLKFAIEEEFSTSVTEGALIRQSPDSGKFLPRGGTVTIVVSKGLPFVDVPTVVGMTTGAATTELEDAGFRVTGVVGSPSQPVVRTDPTEGSSLRLGSRITIYTEEG